MRYEIYFQLVNNGDRQFIGKYATSPLSNIALVQEVLKMHRIRQEEAKRLLAMVDWFEDPERARKLGKFGDFAHVVYALKDVSEGKGEVTVWQVR